MKYIIFLALISSAFAEGPDKVGNGEVVVKCGDRVRLAEYHEAETLDGLKNKLQMNSSQEAVDDQVFAAFKKLDKARAKSWMKDFQQIKSNVNWVKGNYHWNFTNDLGPFPMVDGCEVENVINYYEDDFIEGNKPLFDSLSMSEQAALWVHEVLYKFGRKQSGMKTSLAARRIVTLLFSDSKDKGLLIGLYRKYLLANPATDIILENTGKNITVEFEGLKVTAELDEVETGLTVSWEKARVFLFKSHIPRFIASGVTPDQSYFFKIAIYNYEAKTTKVFVQRQVYSEIQCPARSMIESTVFIIPKSVREFVKGKL